MFSSQAAGRKVYSQGSYAPTRGQVNPKGYIQREIRNQANKRSVSKTGNDGQSDTRSGLAVRALHGNPQKKKLPNINTGGGGEIWGGQQNQAAPAPAPAPQVPQIPVSNTGQLELPYSGEFAQQALDAQQAYDQQMMDLQGQEDANRLAYQSNTRELEQGYKTQQLNTVNNSSGRGLLRSTAHGTAVSEDAGNYLDTKNNLDSTFNMAMGQSNSQKTAAATYLQQILQRLTAGQAEAAAEEAGNLGYGNSVESVGQQQQQNDSAMAEKLKQQQQQNKPKHKPKPKGKGKKK